MNSDTSQYNSFSLKDLQPRYKSENQSAESNILLVFSVTPFKIDQTKNQNLSIDCPESGK